jgi:cell division protein FtsN
LARTEEGEFELILGNRQLISVFLIVVILLGVFFSMGYIVGRNSAPVATEARNTPPAKPIVVEPSRTPAKEAAKEKDTDQPASIEPAPQSTPPPPAAEKKEPVKPAPAVTPAPAPAAEKKPAPEPASTSTVEQPPAGRYWQVVSTSRHEAEIISGAIAKKGIKTIVTPAPKEGFFRVLVGPLGDAADISKTRADLEAAGFKNPVLAKY